jgi:hypothetical protein
MTPTPPRRWLQAAIAEAAKCTHEMPWQRGKRRAQLQASRNTNAQEPRRLARAG